MPIRTAEAKRLLALLRAASPTTPDADELRADVARVNRALGEMQSLCSGLKKAEEEARAVGMAFDRIVAKARRATPPSEPESRDCCSHNPENDFLCELPVGHVYAHAAFIGGKQAGRSRDEMIWSDKSEATPAWASFRLGGRMNAELFMEQVQPEPNTGCWLHDGPNSRGYSYVTVGEQRLRAHRLAWVLFRGPIPDRLLVCHRCDTPCCVNPDHLFLGTHADNNHDRDAKGRHNNQCKDATHCIRNHPLSGDNLVVETRANGRPLRRCRKCRRERDRARDRIRRPRQKTPEADNGA